MSVFVSLSSKPLDPNPIAISHQADLGKSLAKQPRASLLAWFAIGFQSSGLRLGFRVKVLGFKALGETALRFRV